MSVHAKAAAPLPQPIPGVTPRRAAIAVAVLASAVFADTVALDEHDYRTWTSRDTVAWTLLGAILGGLVAHRIAKRGGRTAAAAWAGALGGGVAWLIHSLVSATPDARSDSWVSLFLLATAFMVVIGAIIGAFFGLTALAVFRPLGNIEQTPTVDGLERVLLPASLWLAPVGRWAVQFQSKPLVGGQITLLTALALLAVIVARDVRRLRWLRAVTVARVAGWAIVAKDATAERDPEVPALVWYGETPLDGALICGDAAHAAGPFRDSALSTVVAALPLDPRKAQAPLVRRMISAALIAAAVGALLLFRWPR